MDERLKKKVVEVRSKVRQWIGQTYGNLLRDGIGEDAITPIIAAIWTQAQEQIQEAGPRGTSPIGVVAMAPSISDALQVTTSKYNPCIYWEYNQFQQTENVAAADAGAENVHVENFNGIQHVQIMGYRLKSCPDTDGDRHSIDHTIPSGLNDQGRFRHLHLKDSPTTYGNYDAECRCRPGVVPTETHANQIAANAAATYEVPVDMFSGDDDGTEDEDD